MSFFNNISQGFGQFCHTVGNFFAPPTAPTTPPASPSAEQKQEVPLQTPTQSTTAQTTSETHSAPAQATEAPRVDATTPKSTTTQVRTDKLDYANIELSTLLKLVAAEKSIECENRCRDLYKDIEGISDQMKRLDSFLAATTHQLSTKKEVDFAAGNFPDLLTSLSELGIQAPSGTKLSLEQASPLLQSWEHKREEFERDMKMKHNKFGEVTKDLESLRQSLFQMLTYMRDAISKILNGIRSN